MVDLADQIERIEEVAIAVEDADASVELFETLFGLEFDEQWRIEEDHIRVRATTVAGTQVHCLEPTAEAGPVHSFLQARGEGVHHFCFRVRDLEAMIEHLRAEGARLTPETPSYNNDSAYIFVHPETTPGVLIELIERDV